MHLLQIEVPNTEYADSSCRFANKKWKIIYIKTTTRLLRFAFCVSPSLHPSTLKTTPTSAMSTTATTVRNAAAMRPPPPASATTTILENPTQQQPQTLTLRLNRPKKKVSWKEGTVDNEFMQKKSSKICCIFHKEKPFDEDDSDDDDCNHDHHHNDNKSDGACSSSQKNGGDWLQFLFVIEM